MDSEQRVSTMDIGLLVLRIGIGVMFLVHGLPKLAGGAEAWGKYGQAMGNIGIHFAPAFWGFMAGLSESLGGLLLIAGLCVRWAAGFMLFVMLMATLTHFSRGQGIMGAAHAIEDGIVFVGFLIMGGGKYSVGEMIRKKCCTAEKATGSPNGPGPEQPGKEGDR